MFPVPDAQVLHFRLLSTLPDNPPPTVIDDEVHLFTDGSTEYGKTCVLASTSWSLMLATIGKRDFARIASGCLPGVVQTKKKRSWACNTTLSPLIPKLLITLNCNPRTLKPQPLQVTCNLKTPQLKPLPKARRQAGLVETWRESDFHSPTGRPWQGRLEDDELSASG